MIESWLTPLIQWLGVGSLTGLCLVAIVILLFIKVLKD